MSVKKVRRPIYKECFVMLICLLIFGSVACGVALCFDSEGRVSLKLKPTDCCDEYLGIPVQTFPDLCVKCIDIPISISLAKITRVSKQLNSTFPTPAANVIVPANKFNLSAYNLASNTFEAASYFTPLRAVILLI